MNRKQLLPFCLLVRCSFWVHLTHSSSHVHCGRDSIYFEDPFLGHIIRDLNPHLKYLLSYFIVTEHATDLKPTAS